MTLSDIRAGLTAGHALPDRNVTPETLEDAYVTFILYCNPALPPYCDTEGLREAFRNPPRSGGQVFEPWTIFELVRQFYTKEIKTWTELTVKLGVQPPNPTEESTQKIAQYGVRLKKWLQSMHVKAFFEYVMGMENEYWKQVPPESQPMATTLREGVAMEDDMALRALIPKLRPKRGRKRPEPGDSSQSPAQRQRMSPGSTSAVDELNVDSMGAWPNTDVAQTPLLRWPQSAVTPTMRTGIWDDALMEPKSAITPTKRRGAKNVSSAWKAAGAEPTGRMRGRPPANRTPIEPPTVAMFPFMSSKETESGQPDSAMAQLDNGTVVPPDYDDLHMDDGLIATNPGMTDYMQQKQLLQQQVQRNATRETARAARPSISLQVPDRPGSSVRLATPPTAQQPAETQGDHASEEASTDENNGNKSQRGGRESSADKRSEFQGVPGTLAPPNAKTPTVPEYYFEKMTDRANIDEVMAYFIRITHESKWFDNDGNPAESATMAEASAIINSTLQNMYQSAAGTQAFLINLSALAGARMLMTGLSRCTRVGEADDCTHYKCDWEYRFGNLTGFFTMTAKVPFSMWRAEKSDDGKEHDSDAEGENVDSDKPQSSAKHWQSKYKRLLTEIEKKDKELFALRNKVFQSIREQE